MSSNILVTYVTVLWLNSVSLLYRSVAVKFGNNFIVRICPSEVISYENETCFL